MNSDDEKRKAVEQTLPAPGPWEGVKDHYNYMVYGPELNPLGSYLLFTLPIGQYKQQEATARLAIAAPELLSILQGLVNYYDPNETRPEAKFKLDTAKALIKLINENPTTKVYIHNLVTGVVRTVNREQECLTKVELSAYRSCVDRGETISMGNIIAEPAK